MCADGLTKALGLTDFTRFKKLVGITDVGALIRARELRNVTEEWVEELEIYFN